MSRDSQVRQKLTYALTDCRQALQFYEAVLALDANSTAAWMGGGDALLCQKDLDHARSSYERALAIEPHNSDAFSGIGDVLGKKAISVLLVAIMNRP